MSLEENLAAATNALEAATTTLANFYDAEKDRLDLEVNRLRAAADDLPDAMKISVYVDEVAGNDANIGAPDSPVKTLKEAFSRARERSSVRIYCASDVTMTEQNYGLPRGVSLRLIATVIGIKIKPQFLAKAIDGHAFQLSGFTCNSDAAISFQDFEIEFPDSPGDHIDGVFGSFIRSTSNRTGGFVSVHVGNCDITLPQAFDTNFVTASTLSLAVDGTTYPAEMAGFWVESVAANTSGTAALGVVTNLATL